MSTRIVVAVIVLLLYNISSTTMAQAATVRASTMDTVKGRVSEVTIANSELLYVINEIAKMSAPFCPTNKNDFKNYNHSIRLTNLQLSYKKDTQQYQQLTQQQKQSRVIDNHNIEWIETLCPEVIEYFSTVKYYDFYDKYSLLPKIAGKRQSNDVGMTTKVAMASVCMLRIIDIVATQINMKWALIAGSHLGAIIHGGPIPWDDDTDVIIDYKKKRQFISAVKQFHVNGVTNFNIFQGTNCLKISVNDSSYTSFDVQLKDGTDSKIWRYPYIDVFSYKTNQIIEVGRRKLPPRKTWSPEVFDEIRLYFFGGLMLPALPRYAADIHYNVTKCLVGASSHRGLYFSYNRNHGEIMGCSMTEYFPFLYTIASPSNKNIQYEVIVVNREAIYLTAFDNNINSIIDHGYLYKANDSKGILKASQSNIYRCRRKYLSSITKLYEWLPKSAWNMDYVHSMWGEFSSVINRKHIFENAEARSGAYQTSTIPHLNSVEVDNSIAPPSSCKCNAGKITDWTVVVYNGKRGKHWLEFVQKLRSEPSLKKADVIILNEMDIGMARTENLHTTRLMAHALKMNYAWGLEFVELTNGDKDEQESTKGYRNSLGLTGNAILSKCPLRDSFILRSKFNEKYYSSKATFINAHGYEKRIGGRMGLFAYIDLTSTSSISSSTNIRFQDTNSGSRILFGSIHKIQAENYPMLLKKVSDKEVKGTVIAGDQIYSTCAALGLNNADKIDQMTFPASCSSYGDQHGDVFCTNLDLPDTMTTLHPCFSAQGQNYALSDHAIYVASVKLTNFSI